MHKSCYGCVVYGLKNYHTDFDENFRDILKIEIPVSY